MLRTIAEDYPWVLVLLFPLVWSGALMLVAHTGGWARIAAEYRSWDPFEGRRWRFQSGQFGWSNYGNCLTVGAARQGLYFSVLFLFRPGHPPILVPWSDVTATPGKFLFSRYVDFRFRRVPEARVRLAQRLADRIAAEAGSSWIPSAAGPQPIEPA